MDTKVSSGSEVFDELLEGGYERDMLTTLYGPGGSGKTTLCMLAAITQARLKRKVIYIDTEGGFSMERFRQLAGDETEKLLAHLILLKPTSFQEQNEALKKLSQLVSDKIGLIVVDTLTLFYRLELARKRDFKDLNNLLIWQVNYLMEIARKQNIPILATNQVYADFENKTEVKMVGGDILRYRSKCIVELKKRQDNRREARIVTHRSIPEDKKLQFAIINEGFVKIDEVE
ncbi:MAG: DNA repair and recombination protein RadB [Nanoarchaeota archaeon]|nr:DNA repair and recombination protein RadB [Nanoarchaeota archaeon]